MRAIVKKWGNSASIRIPAALMDAAKLELDDAVEVREEGGRILIRPNFEAQSWPPPPDPPRTAPEHVRITGE